MSNSYNLVPTARFDDLDTATAAIGVLVTTVDTVVDNIRAVDVPAINAGVVAVAVTEQEKALIDVYREPSLNETFLNVAEGAAPDAAVWNVTVVGGGTAVVDVASDEEAFVRLDSGAVTDDLAAIDTKGFLKWTGTRDGVMAVHMKARMRSSHFTPQWCVGMVADGVASDTASFFGANTMAGFYGGGGTKFAKSEGAAQESTDISAFITTTNTWYTLEIILTDASVVFEVDGVVRATHTTGFPIRPLHALLCAKNKGATQIIVDGEFVKVWTIPS